MGGDHSDQPGLLPGVSNRKKPVDQNVVQPVQIPSHTPADQQVDQESNLHVGQQVRHKLRLLLGSGNNM